MNSSSRRVCSTLDERHCARLFNSSENITKSKFTNNRAIYFTLLYFTFFCSSSGEHGIVKCEVQRLQFIQSLEREIILSLRPKVVLGIADDSNQFMESHGEGIYLPTPPDVAVSDSRRSSIWRPYWGTDWDGLAELPV